MIRNCVIIFISLFVTTSVMAGAARNMLESFLQNTASMESSFEQRLFNQRNILLQESSGKFILKRPGRFFWDYKKPYPQQIVSNGKKIWLFDSELEQVSVKSYNQLLAGAPVILLDQKNNLDRDFIVEDQGMKNKLLWVKLIPRNKDGDYSSIEVAMAEGRLVRMVFVDSFEQTTIISFSNIKTNQGLNDSIFEFKVPEGADVVGDF